jgi:regulator of replication initiation timing
MPGISFSKLVAELEVLNAKLKSLLAEFPHLSAEQEQLEDLIENARDLSIEQEDLRGRLRQTIRQRQDAEAIGQVLRSRIAAQLRGKLGFDNELLLGFGVPPRKRSRRLPSLPDPEPPPPTEDVAPSLAAQSAAGDTEDIPTG